MPGYELLYRLNEGLILINTFFYQDEYIKLNKIRYQVEESVSD